MASSSPDKSSVQLQLRKIVRELKAAKANNEGRLPHGALSEMVARMQPTLPRLTREMLKYQMRKPTMGETSDGTRCDGSHCTAAVQDGDSSPNSVSTTMHTMHTSTCRTEQEDDNTRSITVPESVGRPSGNSKGSSREMMNRVKAAKEEAALEYRIAREKARNEGTRAKAGELSRIIIRAKSKYQVPRSTVISACTIQTRAKRNRLAPKVSSGTPSPMLGIEPHIVQVLTQLSRLRTPINVATGLQVVNSVIFHSEYAARVLAWKYKHNAPTRLAARMTGKEPSYLLGKGYWVGFMKRNGHLVGSKKFVKFDAARAEWCTHNSLKTMYQEVYNEMVTGGIAEKLEVEVMYDQEGEAVTEVEASFGLPTMYKVLQPEKLLFVVEIGSNSSEANDGNVRGVEILFDASARPQQRTATKDSDFTVLAFTAATGAPVMCAIIFAAKEMDESWVLGFDPDADWHGDENNIIGNAGRGKRFPMGPSCTFNGITVPTFCCCSENGSLNADLLVAMLSTMDKLSVFDRSEGVPPFLLLDRHGSLFGLPFLEYINNPQTKWNVCIGVPHGTSYWQVGDSSEQNDCFKVALSKQKRELLLRKENQRADCAIEKVDVVDLVSRAWDVSFARAESNRNAMVKRGWSPLNYNCLLYPEIQATQCVDRSVQPSHISADESDAVPPGGLNFTAGIAGNLMSEGVAL